MATLKSPIRGSMLTLLAAFVTIGGCSPVGSGGQQVQYRRALGFHGASESHLAEIGSRAVEGREIFPVVDAAQTTSAPELPVWPANNYLYGKFPPANTASMTAGQLYRQVTTHGSTFYYTDIEVFKDKYWGLSTEAPTSTKLAAAGNSKAAADVDVDASESTPCTINDVVDDATVTDTAASAASTTAPANNVQVNGDVVLPMALDAPSWIMIDERIIPTMPIDGINKRIIPTMPVDDLNKRIIPTMPVDDRIKRIIPTMPVDYINKRIIPTMPADVENAHGIDTHPKPTGTQRPRPTRERS